MIFEAPSRGILKTYLFSKRDSTSFTEKSMGAIAKDLIAGVTYLHSKGVIHGDLVLAIRTCDVCLLPADT